MGTQILLTIPDDLYQHAKRVAKSRQQDVAQLLIESIVLPPEADETDEFISSIPDEDFERERAAFLAMHAALVRDYFGHHVAFYQGEMVDQDQNLAELVKRIRRRYASAFVLIRKVETKPERTYYLRSPAIIQ